MSIDSGTVLCLQALAEGRRCSAPEEIDELNKLSGLDMEFRQLDPGDPNFLFASADRNGETFMTESTGSRLEVFGTPPPGYFTVFIPLTEKVSFSVNGRTLGANEFFILTPATAIHVEAGAGLAIAEMYLPERTVIASAHALAPNVSEPDGPATVVAPLNSATRDYVLQNLAGAILGRGPTSSYHGGLVDHHIDTVANAVARLQSERTEGKTVSKKTRHLVGERARAYIDAHLADRLSMADICHETGVGSRTLERVFHDRLGISPVVYIRARRLNAVRRTLLSTDHCGGTVASIAMAHGFSHLGRFSVDYKTHFGERPSETLRRLQRAT